MALRVATFRQRNLSIDRRLHTLLASFIGRRLDLESRLQTVPAKVELNNFLQRGQGQLSTNSETNFVFGRLNIHNHVSEFPKGCVAPF